MADEIKDESIEEQVTTEESSSEPELVPEGVEDEASEAEAPALEKTPEEEAAEAEMLEQLAAMQETEHEEEPQETEVVTSTADNLDLLMDISLQITVELGRREMRFEEILQLGKGSLVELNKIADEPVDIYVNQSKIALGEVVVVDDHFGVRITKLLNTERVRKS